jgi:hypothetical protein
MALFIIPNVAPQEIEAALAEAGQAVVLRRVGVPNIDVALAGRLDDYAPEDIGGGVVQGDRRVIIGNWVIVEEGWPGPPRRGDQIIWGQGTKTATVMGVATVSVGNVDVRHNLHVRGS